jgi:hypothetical protein
MILRAAFSPLHANQKDNIAKGTEWVRVQTVNGSPTGEKSPSRASLHANNKPKSMSANLSARARFIES